MQIPSQTVLLGFCMKLQLECYWSAAALSEAHKAGHSAVKWWLDQHASVNGLAVVPQALGRMAQVPLKTRQPTLNRLLGQHLAAGLLQSLQLDAILKPKSAQKAVRERAEIRAAAIQAALAQELSLYKACASSPTVRPAWMLWVVTTASNDHEMMAMGLMVAMEGHG